MHRFLIAKLLSVVLVGLVADVAAESLAEAAAREKERRAKLEAVTPAKTYGEEEVASAKGGTYTQMEAPAVKAPTSTTGRTTRAASSGAAGGASSGGASRTETSGRSESASNEASWRSRASQLRAAVPAAEARVERTGRELRITIDSLDDGCPTPITRSIEDVKEVVRTYKCKITTNDDVSRAQSAHDRALADLEKARQELGRLEDDARRAGALPGWIR